MCARDILCVRVCVEHSCAVCQALAYPLGQKGGWDIPVRKATCLRLKWKVTQQLLLYVKKVVVSLVLSVSIVVSEGGIVCHFIPLFPVLVFCMLGVREVVGTASSLASVQSKGGWKNCNQASELSFFTFLFFAFSISAVVLQGRVFPVFHLFHCYLGIVTRKNDGSSCSGSTMTDAPRWHQSKHRLCCFFVACTLSVQHDDAFLSTCGNKILQYLAN